MIMINQPLSIMSKLINMIIRIFLIFSSIVILVSCGNSELEQTKKVVVNKIQIEPVSGKLDPLVVELDIEVEDSLLEFVNGDLLLELKFKTFEMSIDSIDIWNDEVDLKLHNSDTVIVYLALGSSVEDKKIRVKQILEGGLRVFQSYENSITIMNEGPHCDLNDWKHYNSEWVELDVLNDSIKTVDYSEEEWSQFIDVDMSELIEAVKFHCGEEWAAQAKKAVSPTEYPNGVSMSRIYIKVEYQNDKTGTTSSKIIAFEIPMGC